MSEKGPFNTEQPTEKPKEVETIGSEVYRESARTLREVGARVILTIGAAVLIWIFGQLLFIPLAKGMEKIRDAAVAELKRRGIS